jgi:alpha-tubulin suppressor-like RCC1 family protein
MPERAVQVTCGIDFTCALLADGRVKCWGANTKGMLGRTPVGGAFSNAPSGTPDFVVCGVCGGSTPLTGVTQISAGDDVVCARMSNGMIRCWGHNPVSSGQVGNLSGELTRILGCGTDTRFCGGTSSTPGQMLTANILPHAGKNNANLGSAFAFFTVESVSAHALGACAVVADGTARCWGSRENGRLGREFEPTAGFAHVPAVLEEGFFDMSMTPPSFTVRPMAQIVGINGGAATKCALRADGTTWCWGFNASGQAGVETSYPNVNSGRRVNRPGGPLTGAIVVAAGGFQSCAMTATGGVFCWGANNVLNLGTLIGGGPIASTVLF